MSSSSDTGAESFLNALVDQIANRVVAQVSEQIAPGPEIETPWLTTKEAIDYTRLPPGTFRKLAASGRIPSHGGRSKLFFRPELDQTLLSLQGVDDERLRRVQ